MASEVFMKWHTNMTCEYLLYAKKRTEWISFLTCRSQNASILKLSNICSTFRSSEFRLFKTLKVLDKTVYINRQVHFSLQDHKLIFTFPEEMWTFSFKSHCHNARVWVGVRCLYVVAVVSFSLSLLDFFSRILHSFIKLTSISLWTINQTNCN